MTRHYRAVDCKALFWGTPVVAMAKSRADAIDPKRQQFSDDPLVGF
jgi:hypothetical protein